MPATELSPRIETWIRDVALSRSLSSQDTDVIVLVVHQRLVRHWESRGLEDTLGSDSGIAEEYVCRMADKAISVYQSQLAARQEVQSSKVAVRIGGPLPKRPGVRRQLPGLIPPDSADLAQRHLMYDRVIDLSFTLPPSLKATFDLFVAGLKPSEIAELLEVSRDSITESLKTSFQHIRQNF